MRALVQSDVYEIILKNSGLNWAEQMIIGSAHFVSKAKRVLTLIAFWIFPRLDRTTFVRRLNLREKKTAR